MITTTMSDIVKDDYELSKVLIQVTNNEGTHVAVRDDSFENGNWNDYDYVSKLSNVDKDKVNSYLKRLDYVCGEYVHTEQGKILTAFCIVIK